ncbi:kelch repeat and BTB domain-containing protein 12-like [Branchiostoma floridae]|uniref:Kelch repeat and BTB domain-containing protein 12-like n=1 Tax=Branchiostoma floridae TaxID=7739 RepID=A0A9J7KHL7_BRAFL|nr:kelch repeat and BTB domain-containing protein 12-like [Branchiostoma floridae]
MAAVDQEPHASAVHPRSYQNESYLKGFLGTVGDLQKAEVLQDVVLEVEGRRFPCHRLVLSAASPYFRAMFTSDMAESRQKTVLLQGLDANAFGEILSYIYSGTLNVDKVQPLYQAADLLQLDYVRDTCSSYMAMSVQRSTCVDLYKFADVFSVDSVLKRSLHFICMHFAEVASREDFCSLSVNQLTEIISHDELDVKEETTVWEAVVRWVQHSREDRLHHLPSILPHIRFNLLTSDDTAAILDHPLVREDPGRSAIRNVVKEASNQNKRAGMDTLEMAMIFTESTYEIFYMNPREGKYISCTYSEELLSTSPITTASGNSIYIVTEEPMGADTDQLAVIEYSHAGKAWQRANMSSFRRPDMSRSSGIEEFLVEVDKVLYYLFVSRKEVGISVLIRKYDRYTDQWQECSQLKLRISNFLDDMAYYTAVSCGPHIYFLMNTEMQRYDPIQDSWSKRTPPNLEYEFCTRVSLGTKIFCTDFYFSKTMVYDTESDCWQELQGWPNPDPGNIQSNSSPTFFVLENQLHVWFNVLNAALRQSDYLVYVYDRSTDTWRDLEATVPRGDYLTSYSQLPVAHMYLPCLTALT